MVAPQAEVRPLDPLSQLGLIEIGAVSATNDRAEMGGYNPHLRALTALHPSSELIPVARANGVTHAVVAPKGDDGVVEAKPHLGEAAFVPAGARDAFNQPYGIVAHVADGAAEEWRQVWDLCHPAYVADSTENIKRLSFFR